MLTKFPNLWTHSGTDSKAKSSCSGLILNINFGDCPLAPKVDPHAMDGLCTIPNLSCNKQGWSLLLSEGSMDCWLRKWTGSSINCCMTLE